MKDIADDLLDELVELEDTSKTLQTEVKRAQTSKQTLNALSEDVQAVSVTAMLEASALAQEAALHNQQAAEMNLKIHTEQKLQINELTEVGGAWRQAIRNANQEAKSAKGYFAGLLITSIITSVITVGAISWFLINDQKNQQQIQTAVLDLIQTESGLHYRQINLKIDELAAVLELASAPTSPENKASHANLSTESHTDTPEVMPKADTSAHTSQPSAPPVGATDLSEHALAQMKALLDEHKTVIVELHNKQTHPQAPIDLTPLSVKLNKIEQTLLAQSKQWQSANNQKPATGAEHSALNTAELKKQLTQQQAQLNAQLETLKTLMTQLHHLQQQTQEQIKALNTTVEQSQAPKPEQPYTYRNPYQYKE
jgi:hypothetical protein